MSIRIGEAAQAPSFQDAAKRLVANTQVRRNVRHATDVIQQKRARVVGEVSDWQELRESARQIKENTLDNLADRLEKFETACTEAGAHVHWARDADEANQIIIGILKSEQANEVIKVKTMTSDEIGLNRALEAASIDRRMKLILRI